MNHLHLVIALLVLSIILLLTAWLHARVLLRRQTVLKTLYSDQLDTSMAYNRHLARIAARNIGLATALIKVTEPEDWDDAFTEDRARAEVFASAVELLEIREGRHLQRLRVSLARGEL